MTDIPDLRTLAAEATPDEIRAAHWQPSDLAAAEAYHAAVNAKPCEHWKGSPDDGYRTCIGCYVDAALGVYEPAHRRQVLAEAARELRHRADSVPWSDPTLRRGIQYAASTVAMLARDSTSAATETAPRHRQDDETVPAVGREAAQAQGPAEGAAPDRPRTWQLPDGWAIGEVEYGAAHDANCGHWDFGTASVTRESMESWLADHEGWRLIARVRLVPLTDATPADGRDGDGRG